MAKYTWQGWRDTLSSTAQRRTGVLVVIGMLGVVATGRTQTEAGRKPRGADESREAVLASEIRHQLNVLPFYSAFDYLGFSLNGTTVTLTGQVVRPTLKADAETAVRTLEGVTAVANRIEVLPASPLDDALRNAVYRAIYEDPALARYALRTVPSVHIVVKNGNVTLEGSVDTAAEKHVAEARAAGVAKVQSVRNNLIVQGKGATAE